MSTCPISARGWPRLGFSISPEKNYRWMQEAYPADTISLRSVTSDNFVIIDRTGTSNVIGEIDFPSALVFVHEKAIYLHGGQQHHVEHLDFKERKAYVKRVDVDYYTDAVRHTQVRVLEIAATQRGSESTRTEQLDRSSIPLAPSSSSTSLTSLASFASPASSHSHGDVLVRSQVVGFKKIKFFTNENIGDGKLELPENEMHTTSYWITLERPLLESLPFSVSERQSGMFGLLHALASVATLLLMCDGRDLGTAIGERPPSPESSAGSSHATLRGDAAPEMQNGDHAEFTSTRMEEVIGANAKEFFEPNLYLFDAYPGGIGFSEPLFRVHDLLVQQTRSLILACGCA